MKFLPSLFVLAGSIVAGAFLSPILYDTQAAERASKPDAEAVRAEVRRVAIERARGHLQAWGEDRAARDDAGETLRAVFAVHEAAVEKIGGRVNQLQDGVEFAQALYDDTGNRAERDVAVMTGRILNDDLKMGRLLMEAPDDTLRRRAADRLAKAVREGSKEAAELLLLLWTDPVESVSSSARRSTLDLARRAKENEELALLLSDSGLTDAVASRAAEAEGRTKRSYLEALASLKHPAAEQGWVEIYRTSERDRDKIDAARALKGMGRAGPFDELVQRYGSGMTSADEKEARTAIDSLRRLGGDEAKLVLQSALDADPDGPNARRISRALRRVNTPDRRNNRTRGGGGTGGGRRRGGN